MFLFLHAIFLFQNENSISPTAVLEIEFLILDFFWELFFDLETDFVLQFSLTAHFEIFAFSRLEEQDEAMHAQAELLALAQEQKQVPHLSVF